MNKMKELIDIIRGSRKFLIKLIDGISTQELNEIPTGFHNNIIWNIAHAIATQQSLCYSRSGIKPVVGEEFILKYKSGTKPEGFVNDAECKKIIDFLLSAIDQFEKDVEADIFHSYDAFDLKSYPGVKVANVNDAIKFATFHEGIHLGYIMALKRIINNNNFRQS
jgi:hypothetical protein